MTWIRKPGRAPVLRASEKALLHLLRLRGASSKAELARLSNMSAQGVSIIVERLLDLELVRKGEKKRGRVGQPSTPIILNAEGAISVGVFVERRRAQLIVADFQGEIRAERTVDYKSAYDHSTPQRIFDAALDLPEAAGAALWKRRVGIGVAANESLLEFFCHGSTNTASGRTQPSLASRLETEFDVPAYCVNDIRAACIAELAIGSRHIDKSTLYFNLDETLGTGVILEGRLIGPEDQLSSALHTLPIPDQKDVLVGDRAGLALLRRRLEEGGHDFEAELEKNFAKTRDVFERWQADAVKALAIALRAASATVAVDRALIASPLREGALAGFVKELRYTMELVSDAHIRLPDVSTETVAPHPRVRGTAMVPFFKLFGSPEAGLTATPAENRNVA